MMPRLVLVVCAALFGLVELAGAQSGHGPVFGLATPTLARHGWSVEVSAMGRRANAQTSVMLRPMIEYGITEDLQVSLSLPVPVYVPEAGRPVRTMMRMPATPDAEIVLAWRFHRDGVDVGSRFETTAFLGLTYPTDATRSGLGTAAGIWGAAATGYASRVIYAWAGGLYRRYQTPVGGTADHPGDLLMYSLVLGYRPPFFREDFPNPDWRLFVELVGERLAADQAAGVVVAGTGGHQIFLAPTVLGLYGSWGISGGPALPIYRTLRSTQPGGDVRFVLNFSTWF